MKLGWPFNEEKQQPKQVDETALCFARCFGSECGKKVLSYLFSVTKERVMGADCSSNELWFMEGKRALFAQIEHLINKGKGE